MPTFDQPPGREQIARLEEFLASPGQPPGTMTYRALLGFLFGIATAPVLVKPSEWLPAVFGGGEPSFDNEEEAQSVLSAIMSTYNAAVAATEKQQRIRPADVGLLPQSEPDLLEWSLGFVAAFGALEDAWEAAVEVLDDEDLEVYEHSVAVFVILSDPDAAQSAGKLSDDDLRALTRGSRSVLGDALAFFATVGPGLYRASLAKPRAPAQATHVGRNDPCPCGSGKKYKRCCDGPADGS